MSAPFIGLFGILALFVLLFLRLPVWAALAVVGFVGNVIVSNWTSAIATLGQTPFDTASLYTLSVVPLFILTGGIAAASGLSADLFKAARVMLSGLRGGLAVATIGASACFGAVCGSSIATAATMTPISLREMRKAGYADTLATGAIAAGGTLGILFPPSIILVIYGAISPAVGAETVRRRPVAGIAPHRPLYLRRLAGRLSPTCRRAGRRKRVVARTRRGAARALAISHAVHHHHRRHLCRHLQPDRSGVGRFARRHPARPPRPPIALSRNRSKPSKAPWSPAACCS